MTARENLLSLYRRKGYEYAPVYFVMCPSLLEEFHKRYGEHQTLEEHFNFPSRIITDPGFPWIAEQKGFVPSRNWNWQKYYPIPVKQGARMDIWGIAHEPGGPEVKHMTFMRHPLENIQSVKELEEYPWPDFTQSDFSIFNNDAQQAWEKGLAVQVWMECTIWETAWYMRGMENLMVDMALNSDVAYYLLDKLTELAVYRAKKYAGMGADILMLGDDIGMQSTLLMQKHMYQYWLKPRLTKVIEAAKSIKPDILIQYHSCGYIEPLIDDLIEAGIDILNPVQPECMDFEKIYHKYGKRLSFNGSIGTQTTMPFGTVKEVKEIVRRNLSLAGKNGGLFCCPTHMLEPEVPWESVEAYVEACNTFTN
jgi:uroporphyrinogen decarboxylase